MKPFPVTITSSDEVDFALPPNVYIRPHSPRALQVVDVTSNMEAIET